MQRFEWGILTPVPGFLGDFQNLYLGLTYSYLVIFKRFTIPFRFSCAIMNCHHRISLGNMSTKRGSAINQPPGLKTPVPGPSAQGGG